MRPEGGAPADGGLPKTIRDSLYADLLNECRQSAPGARLSAKLRTALEKSVLFSKAFFHNFSFFFKFFQKNSCGTIRATATFTFALFVFVALRCARKSLCVTRFLEVFALWMWTGGRSLTILMSDVYCALRRYVILMRFKIRDRVVI